MNINFENNVIFLTGGNSGIGKHIKTIFVSNGGTVIAPKHDELDLMNRESIEKYMKKNKNFHPDIFIHCAGINKLAGINDISQKILDDVFQVNFFSPVTLLKVYSEHMKAHKWGRIIFISSLYALVSREKRIAYSSSKNALTGLTKTLALELAPYNILVNSIAPGYVMTEMTRKNLSEKEMKEIASNIPTGRFQIEDEVGSLVAFLCSNYNQSITGQLIAIDGGFTCR